MISVALAAYCGEKYIAQQLNSILCQLSAEDEIVVSDDAPGGETEKAVQLIAQKDTRIKYVHGPGKGLIKNFEYAMSCCSGDVIFLSDQDDIWLDSKVFSVMRMINDGACLVLHDAYEADQNLNIINQSYFEIRGSQKGFLRNIFKNSYMGCCMAFTREIMEKSLPFPDNIPMHDQWIGLTAEKCGRVEFLPQPLIYHRLHGENMTGGATETVQKIKWRLALIRCLMKKDSRSVQ